MSESAFSILLILGVLFVYLVVQYFYHLSEIETLRHENISLNQQVRELKLSRDQLLRRV